MKEKTLLRIALVITIVGLLILVIISQTIKIDETSISKINNEKIDENLKLSGKITKITATNDTVFLQIQSQDTISAIIFKDKDIDLKRNDIIEIEGNVQDYNGNLEIIADKVRVIG